MAEPARLTGALEVGAPRQFTCGRETDRGTCGQPCRAYKANGRTYHEGLCEYHGDLEFSVRWQARYKAADEDARVRLRREIERWTARGRKFYGPSPDRQYIDRTGGDD
jgi:hypothetical protein